MRIAVCPAAGAVRARRRGDPRGRPRRRSCARAATRPSSSRVPFKWYPGARVLTQAFLWRLLDLTEAEGRPIDLVIATKFPSYAVRHPNKVVWLAAPVPAGVRARPHRARPVLRVGASDRATRRAVHASRPARARRGAQALRHLAQRRRSACERSTGLDAEVLPHPPQELAVPLRRLRRLRPLRRPARPREARRPPDRGRRRRARLLRVVVAGDGPDREPARAARAASAASTAASTFSAASSDEELAGLYARCLAVYYAPVDEDFGMVPYEAFLAEKPVVTTDRRGRPARGREPTARPASCASRARPRSPTRSPGCASTWTRPARWGRAGQRARRAR